MTTMIKELMNKGVKRADQYMRNRGYWDIYSEEDDNEYRVEYEKCQYGDHIIIHFSKRWRVIKVEKGVL